MKRRVFAADSSVPIDRTRAEITKLLSSWGCMAMGWSDRFADGGVQLDFSWDPVAVARMGQKRSYCRTHYNFTCAACGWKDGFKDLPPLVYRVRLKVAPGKDPQKQRTAHRLLLLKLKADLNAAQAGLVKAEEVFLPWIVDDNGTTVSDHVLPLLAKSYAALPPSRLEPR